ncbi:MAG: hypothetical protein AB9907_16480 [Flexilinea sp.]
MMSGILREEFYRAFVNKRFWLVAILAAISFTFGFRQVMGVQPDSSIGCGNDLAGNHAARILWLFCCADGRAAVCRFAAA